MNSTLRAHPLPPRAPGGTRPRQPLSLRAVSAYVPRLTRKAFAKYGFASTALLTDWASIAGADIASYSAPERLKWPRSVNAYDEIEEGAERRPGATLILRVDGPRAIELQHKAHQLIERINASFGYRAVAELRFVQSPLGGTSTHSNRPSSRRRPAAAAAGVADLATVADEPLRGALLRLQANIRGAAG